MEESILEMLDNHMLFADLEQVERSNLDACAGHDDKRDLRDYDFEADNFGSCLLHLVRPLSVESGSAAEKQDVQVSELQAEALQKLAYRCRYLADRYDNQNIAPHSVQTTQR